MPFMPCIINAFDGLRQSKERRAGKNEFVFSFFQTKLGLQYLHQVEYLI